MRASSRSIIAGTVIPASFAVMTGAVFVWVPKSVSTKDVVPNQQNLSQKCYMAQFHRQIQKANPRNIKYITPVTFPHLP